MVLEQRKRRFNGNYYNQGKEKNFCWDHMLTVH